MFSLLVATYLWDFYRTGFAIALLIQSLDARWGLGARGSGVSIHLQELYGICYRVPYPVT